MTSKYSVPKIVFNLIVLGLIAARIWVECKPIDSQQADNQVDAMLAIPSENSAQQVVYVQPGERDTTDAGKYHMMVPYEVPAQAQEATSSQVAAGERQEIYYVVDSDGQRPSEQAPELHLHNHDGRPCNNNDQHQQYEQAAQGAAQEAGSAKRGDYPAEILYVGQENGDAPTGGQDLILNSGERASDYATALGQSSGLPATILSEVPERDIPAHVLEKLKRHYGVRVVATRERPGANLVINCDDYHGQSGAICAGKAASASSPLQLAFESAVNSNEDTREQPRLSTTEINGGDHIQGYRFANEADNGKHSSRHPAASEHELEGFGTRFTLANEHEGDSPAGGEQEGDAHQPDESHGSDREQGFDEQPATSSDDEGSHTQRE